MRTSNMPPGLKRYWQGKARKSGGGRKRSSSGGSTAIVRYSPTAPAVRTRTRTVTKIVRKGGGGTSVMRREMGSGKMVPGPFRLKSMGVASLIGYSEAGKGFAALQEFVQKLPEVGKLPKEALAGLVLNYFGDRNEWVDAAAQAFLDVGAYKVGQSGYTVSGDDNDDD
jgi:hypothetical protein